MAVPPSRTPPRFVPTLTEVVRVPDAISVQSTGAAPLRATVGASAAPSTGQSTPAVAHPPLPHRLATPLGAPSAPRRDTGPVGSPAAASAAVQGTQPPSVPTVPSPSAGKASAAAWPKPLPEGIEEHMVHRVMQRVDVVLDQRLREAIATVVQEQTRSVLPRLREEIESVVRHAVYEAVADELASGTTIAPQR
jgi:hypothetical protein